MYSMVLMAALATGTGTPDFGYWGGWGGYGLGWGGYGLGSSGYGLGWGGYGSGWGGYGSGWGGWGGNGLGLGGWGYGYGGYPLGGYGYSPMISSWGWGSPLVAGGSYFTPGMNQSFYYNPAAALPARANPANEARLIVHLPPQASLTIDDYPSMSRSDRRIFATPPLEPGKTYTYTLRGEINRDGRFIHETKTVEVKAGEVSEVTLRFGDVSREELGAPTPKESPSRR